MILRFLLVSLALGLSTACFALSNYFDQLSENDRRQLEEVCLYKDNEEARITPTKYASQYADTIGKLHKKYPALDFSNPCGW